MSGKKSKIGRKTSVIIVLSLFFLGILLVTTILLNKSEDGNDHHEDNDLDHIHGIYAVGDKSLYIATHNGLMKFDGDHIDRVGVSTDDFMSFAVHPKNSTIMFASGHSNDEHESKEDYRNLNVLRSKDGGESWEEISQGVNGPVDFHALSISSANPAIMYGWFYGLQRSLDGGYNWEIIDTKLYDVFAFETDSNDENIVYAATLNGLMVSYDKGENWDFLSEELRQTPVISLAINQNNSSMMLSNSKGLGLASSKDGGLTWQKVNEEFDGELVTYIDYDLKDTDKVYAITRENSIFISSDGGIDWKRIY